MLDRLSQELRYALRTLRRSPGYAAVVVLTLAVGIGANTAIFSVVQGVLLDELPYDEPARVVGIWQYTLDTGERNRVTPGNFVDIRNLTQVFDAAAAFGLASTTLLTDADPELIRGGRVSAGYFDVLGVRPLLGRPFGRADEEVGGADVVILGEELWRRRFAGDPEIIGTAVSLNGTPFEVVGVLPRGVYPTYASVDGDIPFTPDNHDYLVPLRFTPEFYGNRRPHILGAIGRLADGVTVEQADDAVERLAASLREQYPLVAGEGFTVSLLRDEIVGGARPALLVLMGTVAVVLLIAATNVAGIMLARADARRSETAVRAALGAGRAALVRQSLAESLILTGAGTVAGVALAYLGLDAIKRLVPFQIPRMGDVTLDLPALAFAVAVAAVVGTVIGATPALLASRAGMLARLRQGATGLSADGRQRWAQGTLVAAQACMAVMLVIGAGLLVRTFVHIKRIDPGFAAERALTLPVSLPSSRYPAPVDQLAFFQRLDETLASMPGVASVAFGYDHPLSKSWGDSFRIEGAAPLEPGQSQGASFRPVSPGWFETAGIPLLRGRTLAATDDLERPPVVVINEAFAEQFFPGVDPVGRRLRIPTIERMFGDGSEEWREIVGIVGNVRFNGPTEPHEAAMYVPIPQVPMGDVVLLVAPERAGVDLLAATRRAIHSLDAELPITSARTLDTILDDAAGSQRFNMLLVGLFAVLALALAGLGIYGLMARLVATQVKQIGIRVALGARRAEVLALVLTGALVPVLAGGLLGLTAAAGLSRLLEGLLYQVPALDPVTFVITPLVLAAIALLASWLPARRAAGIDPVVALRQE